MIQEFAEIVYKKAPMQKPRLAGFLKTQDKTFWRRGDEFAERFCSYLDSQNISKEVAVDCFLEMCKDTIIEQVAFARTGEYSCKLQAAAYESIYSNIDKMRSYMIAVALSQFFWKNHYLMYDYFLNTIPTLKHPVKNYLEIGPGHGMFLAGSLNQFDCDSFTAIDISPISIEISKGFLPFLTDKSDLVKFVEKDAMKIDETNQFDFIVMGEVIEHLDTPDVLLCKLATLLTAKGAAFYTTCANCPMIDHVYLFHDAAEMRQIFYDCGYKILDELLMAVEKDDESRIEDKGIPTNYANLVALSD